MLKGGIADKLGNDYEAFWTLVEALRVLRGEADEIRIEPFNEDAKYLREWWRGEGHSHSSHAAIVTYGAAIDRSLPSSRPRRA